MSKQASQSSEQLLASTNSDISSSEVCVQCGGNGYTKSSPNHYRTCLGCLGKGLISNKSR